MSGGSDITTPLDGYNTFGNLALGEYKVTVVSYPATPRSTSGFYGLSVGNRIRANTDNNAKLGVSAAT